MTSRLPSRIEPLEDRIAPALLVNGANLLGGAGNPTTGETSVGDNSVTLVKVLSGQALVWFDDGIISSISFGPNTNLEIHGDIAGDVVGNLTAAGTLSDSDNNASNGEDGSTLLANNLVGLKTLPLSGEKGSLGNIITGGSIGGLSISGEIFGAYAGDGVFRPESSVLFAGHVTSSVGTLDINPVASGTQSTFDFTKAGSLFQPGASIRTATITLAPALQMFAGSGSPSGVAAALAGAAGGSISGITIESAVVPAGAAVNTPSYWLIAGNGADGKTGGAGGSIDHIIEKASFGPVKMFAGNGGAGAGGAGGIGGAISYLDVQSNSAHYIATAGNGGNGAPAGDGGRMLYNNFSNRTPVSGIIKAADFTGDKLDDILVIDAATGQMIIDTQQGAAGGSAAPFHQLVQFQNQFGDPVVLINPAGVSPSDALVMDINGDNLLDIVVAYKNSTNLGVFLNQGGGVFYDPNIGANGDFASHSFGLSFAPAKIATDGFVLAIGENSDGKGTMRYGIPGGSTVDDLTLDLSSGKNEFSQPIADVVYNHGQFITAFTSGQISNLQPAGITATKAFIVTPTGVAIGGGVSDLEIDSTGNLLLALSEIGHTVSVFNTSGATLVPVWTIPLSASADPLVAHFIHDADNATPDDITVLASLPSGSTLTSFTQTVDADPATPDPFAQSANLNSAKALKNFVPVYKSTGAFIGDAELAGSMNSFIFTTDLIATSEFPLPFASKIIEGTAGNGGTGLNLGKLIGKGGAGGAILGINADANDLKLHAGVGGPSGSGPGGAGGSVINPASFNTAGGVTVVPSLTADVVLQVVAGDGGTPVGPAAKTATGGVGGSLTGLSITLDSGPITLTTGTGGNGLGGAGGAGGSFNGVKTVGHDGDLTLSTGDGGKALAGAVPGGAGGSIINFSHTLDLNSDVELLEKAYTVTITTGDGGTSVAGIGGAGGSLMGVSLKLDGADRTYNDPSVTPPLVDSGKDSTVRVVVSTGIGGQGATGGAGGTIRDFAHTSVFDQLDRHGLIRLNYVVMQLTAGAGGQGTTGVGGAGGAIQLLRPISGVTDIDPDVYNPASAVYDPADPNLVVPFIAIAGAGGDGSTKGGAGGAVTGLKLQNAAFADGASITTTHLFAATVTAGNGGIGLSSDGGVGGAVSGALIGTQGGFLTIAAGNGGHGGLLGKGGAGGAVTTSSFGVVNTSASVGLQISGGAGGGGTLAGGAGGALSSLQVSTPQSTNGISAMLVAGNGGAANSNKGLGGKGGDISTLNQLKDVNSSINLIQAGNGGDNPGGTAGPGGNILGIKTVGFIGRPSDGVNRLGVFDKIGSGPGAIEIAQGLFSGRGGMGVLDGINGAVTNVSAHQIAAIAAAVDGLGHFAAASKITGVKAALIGFDKDGLGTFSSTGAGNPGVAKPIDGFIWGTSISMVTTMPPLSFVFTP